MTKPNIECCQQIIFFMNRIASRLITKPLFSHQRRQFTEYLSPHFLLESTLFQLHEYMPWGLAIISGTVLFRTIGTLPVAITERKRYVTYAKIVPLLKAWSNTAPLMAPKFKAKPGQDQSMIPGKIVWKVN
jgi:hypothetical protein